MDTPHSPRPGLLTTAIVILWIQGAAAVLGGLYGLAYGLGGGITPSGTAPGEPVPDEVAASQLIVGIVFAAVFAAIAVVLMSDAVALTKRQPGSYALLMVVEGLIGLIGVPMILFGTGLIQVPLAVLVMVGVLTKGSKDWLAGRTEPLPGGPATPAPPEPSQETERRPQE
ncbi:hypothetical protein [Promicromonospora soli]